MQKILIVEDDPIQLEMLYETIHTRYPGWEIKKGSSFEAAHAFLQDSITANEYFTLFLLDIQLRKDPEDRSGFQLAQKIREISVYYKTPILFLTSVSEELSRALTQFHCYNFITKPYQRETVLEQLRQMLLTGYLQDVLDIADTQRIRHRIQPQDIRYVESRSHTIFIYTVYGCIQTREYSLSAIAQQLGTSFVRCHRRYLINPDHITGFDRSARYLLTGKDTIPVSQSGIALLEDYL
ncbi:LytTR family DNA-binding domain-containing protein [Kineothrix sp. MSJ-39]|uniref:LytR/AlgR family response regulator transcription factor n=1 Tax=Kineothrix sp. MSJ-39 TaxID=2841533 RepID=UPI001C1286F5|nr:LytTR family DNA-binding domain-containing protein [Kineothrix sp. MSJ-39]MBU5429849.1 LytTR family DNA-binding domain-containing protein [Kineothrix sp. MSJ-39]